jgi:hypothetical protein
VAQLPFEGMKYDHGHALAIADAIEATIGQARQLEISTGDLLAALGIAAARVIMASGLQHAPRIAVQRLADYILAQAGSIAAP